MQKIGATRLLWQPAKHISKTLFSTCVPLMRRGRGGPRHGRVGEVHVGFKCLREYPMFSKTHMIPKQLYVDHLSTAYGRLYCSDQILLHEQANRSNSQNIHSRREATKTTARTNKKEANHHRRSETRTPEPHASTQSYPPNCLHAQGTVVTS